MKLIIMDTKKIITSSLPSVFFFIGLLFLAYSPLALSKIVTIQNDAVIIFIEELKKTDLSSSLNQTFNYLWSNLLWILVVFSSIICTGFVINLIFLEKIDFNIMLVSNVVLILLIFVLTNFSMIMLLTGIGIILGNLWAHKTFEKKKNDFSTCYSFVKSKLKTMNLFLTLGIFLAILMNISAYEKQIYESNIEMITGFIPDMEGLEDLQKTQVQEMVVGIKSSLNEQYKQMPENTKTQCKPMYTGLIQGLDNYEQQIEEQELGIGEEQILEQFPFFDITVKTAPLFVAIGMFILLGILSPVMSIVSGIVYTIIRKIKPS